MVSGKILATFIACASFVTAQGNSPYCDSSSGICYQGYYDSSLDITVGLVFPPLTTATTPNATEFIAQLVAPVNYGWTGLSVGGTMANSLLFTLWPNGDEIIFGPRWTAGYVQPLLYSGPKITLLPDSTVNSTHIKASFRCQNCTVWEGGSIGSGNLNGFQLIAYVASTDTPVDDPSNVASNFTEHNDFDFFGLDLSTVHSSSYSSYIGGGSTSSTLAPTSTIQTSTSVTATSSAAGATQTKYGQCGGTGWTGPTICASGSTCTAVSAPYYSQCL